MIEKFNKNRKKCYSFSRICRWTAYVSSFFFFENAQTHGTIRFCILRSKHINKCSIKEKSLTCVRIQSIRHEDSDAIVRYFNVTTHFCQCDVYKSLWNKEYRPCWWRSTRDASILFVVFFLLLCHLVIRNAHYTHRYFALTFFTV